jgi:hypothetical protein
MPCELPGLAKTPFAGRALRSKAVVRGGNPERRGPTMVLYDEAGRVCFYRALLHLV